MRSGPARSRWPAMSAAHPGCLAMPSTAGSLPDHPQRRRLLRSPAGVASESQAMPSRRHGGRWSECRGPPRLQWPAPPRHLRSRDGRARPAPRLAAVDAILQTRSEPASGASGFDRIVGVMSASESYDTVPSNCGRGATMGPPACPLQSPPVPFRWRRRSGLQGLSANRGDWRRQKVFLIRKRSQVRVLDRPLAGIQEFAAFAQFSRIWLLEGRHGRGVRGATMGPRAVTCEAEKRSLVRASVRWAGAPGTPSAAC